jgi:hypothetical protein
MRALRNPARTLRLFGLFLVLGPGVPVALRLLLYVREAPVVECSTTFEHRHYAHATLGSGQTVILSPDDIRDPAHCLPPGTLIEKRRGDLGYRVNGQYALPPSPSWKAFPVLLGAGLLLFAGSFLVRRT